MSFSNDFSKEIFEMKYQYKNESWNDFCKRIAEGCFPDNKEKQEKFRKLLYQHKISLAGRVLYGLNTDRKNVTFSNCYVIPVIHDSMDYIMQTAKNASLIMKAGGGVGYNFSVLRPKEAIIKSTGEKSTGVIEFMKIFDQITKTIRSGGCFTGDTIIITDEGLVPIKEIVDNKVAKKVLTLNGFKNIVNRFNNGKKKIIKIILENGIEIKCTPSHNFLFLDENGAIKEKPISEFKVGDFVYLNVENVNFNCKNTFPFTNDFGYFIGFYFGNGCNIKIENKKDQYKGIKVAFTDNEIGNKCLNKCKEILKNNFSDINIIIKKGNGKCKELFVYSINLINQFKKYNLLKQKAKYIKIPDIIYYNDEIMYQFIAGYFDADGYIKNTKKGFSVTSISDKILKQIQLFLMSKGIVSKFRILRKKYNNWNELYLLNITGKTWQTKFKECISSHSIKQLDNISKQDKQYGFPSFLLGKVFYWKNVCKSTNRINYNRAIQNIKNEKYNYLKKIVGVKIKDIVNLNIEEIVYDIEVEDKHHYFANGVLVHNSRRGANIGILDVWHPEVEYFIEAKRDGVSLTQFNISVAINDKFMKAVENNEDWDLIFPDTSIPEYDKYWGNIELENFYTWFEWEYYDKQNNTFYFDLIENDKDLIIEKYQDAIDKSFNGNIYKWIEKGYPVIKYKTIKARELYEKIMKSNYEYAEPGVVFIDTVNRENNLYYIEEIRATNPCGEETLFNYSSCNLGAINLSEFVINPFNNPEFDIDKFKIAIELMIEALDYILDINYYPLIQQQIEVILKRPIGLGISGLGDSLAKMKLKYSSEEGRQFFEKIMKFFAITSYKKSIELAKEKERFLLYDNKLLDSEYMKRLLNNENELKEEIKENGLRNCRLLTIAPTGTISLAIFNNCSNGIEPIFSLEYKRKVLQEDETQKEDLVQNEAWRLYKSIYGENCKIPEYFELAEEIDPFDHIKMMAIGQKYIDASISKTINVPEDYPFEKFKDIYLFAYKNNLKGCTTYRPNNIIAPVMEKIGTDENKKEKIKELLTGLYKKELLPIEEAKRYSVKYKNAEIYVNVVHDEDGNPLEVYASPSIELGYNGKNFFEQDRFIEQLSLWQCICRLISLCCRYSIPVEDITKHLYKSTYSIVSLPGILYRILSNYPLKEYNYEEDDNIEVTTITKNNITKYEKCPSCGKNTYTRQGGCKQCLECGYTTCG